MTARERRLLLLVSVFGVLGALYAGYALVIAPIQENRQKALDLEAALSEREAVVDKLAKDRKRLETARRRSLPANPDDARREYEAAIRRILREAEVPPGYTISQKDNTNTQTVPELEPKKPAYQRIGYSIQLRRVSLPTVAKVLEGYYGLNLLHRITEFDLKKDDSVSVEAPKAGAKFDPLAGRDNLEVTLVTEAIILDGAEARKTLLSVPTGFAGLGGWAGYQSVALTPEAGRGLKPANVAPVLSAARRDYFLLAAKDVFHGPLPPYPPIKITRGPDTPEAPPPPKDDISEYVKLTDITRRSDGTSEAHIRDKINNRDYQIDLRPRAERLEVKVQKFLFVGGARKRTEILDEERTLTYLVIREDDAATDRRFKIAGLEADGLVLVETVEVFGKADKKEPPKKDDRAAPGGNRPQGGSSRGPGGSSRGPSKKLEPAQLSAAVVGGIGVIPPPAKPVYEDRVFVWRVGQTLDLLTPLGKDEGQALLKRVAATGDTVPASLTKAE